MGASGEKAKRSARTSQRRPATYRMARINKLLRKEISLLLEQRVKNDVARNAVITDVDCARDLPWRPEDQGWG